MMLSDVCLSRTSGLSREQRGLGRPKLAQVAHVTRDSDTTFKVKKSKGQGHRSALLTAALTRQAAAAVAVGKYSPWEPTATLPSAGASAPTGGEGRGISWRPPVYSLFILQTHHRYKQCTGTNNNVQYIQ